MVSAAVLALGVAGCGAGGDTGSELSGEIAGAGASSQQAAQEAWIVEFQNENAGVTISYDPAGSGSGRKLFAAAEVAYAGTDGSLSEDENALERVAARCRPGELLEIPAYVSPIAVVYNLPDVKELRLDPRTLARIFNQEITDWNDPAIAATNVGVELPDLPIVPVNRSDESATTESFVDYLSAVAANVRLHDGDGDQPAWGGEAASGAAGVARAVGATEGAIGYVDANRIGDLGFALIEVGDEFVGPTAEAAAKMLEVSPEDGAAEQGRYMFPLTVDLRTDEPGSYPIVLVSYLLACTEYGSADEAELVRRYLGYAISEEGQQAAAASAGSGSIPASLRERMGPAVEAIQTGAAIDTVEG